MSKTNAAWQFVAIECARHDPDKVILTLHGSASALARDAVAGINRQLQEYEEDWLAKSPAYAKYTRYTRDLDEVEVGTEVANRAADDCLRAAQQALVDNQDPTPHEDAHREHKRTVDVLTNRINPLRELRAKADREWREALQQSLLEKYREVQSHCWDASQAAIGTLTEAVAPLLTEALGTTAAYQAINSRSFYAFSVLPAR